jgi:pimeloyl-ACP methyl ester carboxylesterase
MPELTFTRLAGSPARDLLVVGPSLGTAVAPLWQQAATLLGDRFEVVGWDLPGHGRSAAATGPFGVADLAAAVTAGTEALLAEAGGTRRAFYAGVSLGGAVGFQLALADGPFEGIAALASAPVIGEPQAWLDRAALVRRSGTPVMVEGSAQRWFAPGFLDRDPATAGALLLSLSDADAGSYALACEALAAYDVRPALHDAATPLTLVAGEHDPVVTPEAALALTDGTPVRTLTLAGCGHLPPAEVPAGVAAALADLFVHEPQESR